MIEKTLDRVRRLRTSRLFGPVWPQAPGGLVGGFMLLLILVLAGLGGLCAASSGRDPQPQPPAPRPPINLTLRVGEQVTKSLWCRNPVNGSPSMTIAAAGTLTNSAPQIASASLVEPNGNNGQGTPITQGLVESPRIRITGLKPSPPKARITIDLSCPELFNPARGIGLVPHQWVKQTIVVTVVAPPPVPNPGKGGKAGGDEPGNPGGDSGSGGGNNGAAPIGPDTATEHDGSDHSQPGPDGDVPIEILPLDLQGGSTQPECGAECNGGPSACNDGPCATETPPYCSDGCDPCSDDGCSEAAPEHQCPGAHDCGTPPTVEEQHQGVVDGTPSR